MAHLRGQSEYSKVWLYLNDVSKFLKPEVTTNILHTDLFPGVRSEDPLQVQQNRPLIYNARDDLDFEDIGRKFGFGHKGFRCGPGLWFQKQRVFPGNRKDSRFKVGSKAQVLASPL